MLESMRYQAEAEVRWLDHCETALARARRAGPREGTHGPPRPPTARSRPSGGTAMTGLEPALELIDVSRIHGRGDGRSMRCAGSTSASRRASWSRSWARRAPASRPCSTWPADSTRPPPAGSGSRAGARLARQAGLAQLRRRRVGYVFQDYNLIPTLTAAGERRASARAGRVAARKARPRWRAACSTRSGSAGLVRPLPGRAVRRPAAAGGDRPRGRRRPQPDPRRRADRRAGLRDRRAGARRCCGIAATPGRRRCWSPTRPGTPAGPTGWCSSATAPWSTRPRRLGRPDRACWRGT